MGTEPDEPGYELGAPCVGCWGDLTPKRFLAIANGIQQCPPNTDSPNDFVVLTQQTPCTWLGLTDLFSYHYQARAPFMPPVAVFTIQDLIFRTWFIESNPVLCTLSFTNSLLVGDCGPAVGGFGGSVELYFGPGI